MAFGNVVDIWAIAYLDRAELHGRFISKLAFHDTGWRVWLATTEPGKFVEVQAWPAEMFYFARAPENPSDFRSDFFDLMGQRGNFSAMQRPFSAIQDDIFNLSASIQKVGIILSLTGGMHAGRTRLVATELEYILLVCRSMFDLLQECLKTLWKTVQLLDAAQQKKELKKHFSDMVLSGDTLRTADEIASRFSLPTVLANCYTRHAPLFIKIREFRDNLVHRGVQVQTIFPGDRDFLIRKRFGPFSDLNIWRDHEIESNELVPLTPAIGMTVLGTLHACDDFARTLADCIQFPNPSVPGMRLFMRGYFIEALQQTLTDAQSRETEGRSLNSYPV